MIGRSTETMSSSSVTGVAPCLIKLLVPSARGNQRTGTLGRFHDDDSKRQVRNQPIATWKIPRPRLPAKWHLSQSEPGAQDFIKEVRVLRGIDPILASGKNSDGTGCKASAVRGGIDAAREARYGGKSKLTKSARQPLGDLHAGGRSIA
jgi:hypothetical protein